MGIYIFMLLIEFALFVPAEIYLLRRDLPYAFYFGALYLYSTPALIGYLFFPYLSKKINAYFGMGVWYKFYFFIILSLITFFLCTCFYIRKIEKMKPRKRKLYFISHRYLTTVTLFIICMLGVFQIYNMVVNSDYIGYQIASKTNSVTRICGILFQVSVGYILVLYYFMRKRINSKYDLNKFGFMFFFSVIIFFAYAMKTGNRHVLLELVLGILYMEMKLKYLNRKTMFRYGVIMFAFIVFMSVVRANRSNLAYEFSFSLERILNNDFYPPAHMLFAAIYYHYVQPGTVIVSNIANSLVGLNVNYLQFYITELIAPGLVTRSSSYAFYIFTEGYMFGGGLGFLYNGFVMSSLMYLWRKIAITNDENYSIVLTAIMAAFSVDLVRGQSAYFIRDLWMIVLPNAILYSLLSGIKKKNGR